MRTGIVERKECTIDVKQHDLFAFDIDQSSLARCDLACARCSHKFGHACFLSWVALAGLPFLPDDINCLIDSGICVLRIAQQLIGRISKQREGCLALEYTVRY